MHKPILAVTGDTHGEKGRFFYPEELTNKHLQKGDYLFICGDFGYLLNDTYGERQFLKYLAEDIPYTICFCDGNHENFDLINSYEVTTWNGGKVHIIKTDKVYSMLEYENRTPEILYLNDVITRYISETRKRVANAVKQLPTGARADVMKWISKNVDSDIQYYVRCEYLNEPYSVLRKKMVRGKELQI